MSKADAYRADKSNESVVVICRILVRSEHGPRRQAPCGHRIIRRDADAALAEWRDHCADKHPDRNNQAQGWTKAFTAWAKRRGLKWDQTEAEQADL